MANELFIHRVSKVDIKVRAVPFATDSLHTFHVTELTIHYTENDGHESTFDIKLFGSSDSIQFGQIGQAIAEKAKEVHP